MNITSQKRGKNTIDITNLTNIMMNNISIQIDFGRNVFLKLFLE